jgi:hypothetical protein
MGPVYSMIRTASALVLAALPSRHWGRCSRWFDLSRYAIPSAVLTLGAAIAAGVPGFIRHAQAGAAAANQVTVAIAGEQVAGRAPGEVTTSFAQALSGMSALGFVLTLEGFLVTYFALSGALRLCSAFVDDPMGDPFLTACDYAWRGVRSRIARVTNAWRLRRQFGPVAPDRVVRGGLDPAANCDFTIVCSRPKAGWTDGAVVVSRDGCYYLDGPVTRTVDGILRIVYFLHRKTDSAIVRRTVTYALLPEHGSCNPPGNDARRTA